jgi:hypothetical protein
VFEASREFKKSVLSFTALSASISISTNLYSFVNAVILFHEAPYFLRQQLKLFIPFTILDPYND